MPIDREAVSKIISNYSVEESWVGGWIIADLTKYSVVARFKDCSEAHTYMKKIQADEIIECVLDGLMDTTKEQRMTASNLTGEDAYCTMLDFERERSKKERENNVPTN
tara:strand:- start:22100 stop:22423 length:324 start_codon:yes stop_codon:yes gene_type:complete